MRVSILVKDYTRYSDARLDLKTQTISAALTGNPYSSPDNPLVDEFTDARTLFSTELNEAASGDHVGVANKKKARADLLKVMRRLAVNLEDQAKGDRAKLISTGFDLASEGESMADLQAPPAFKLSDGVNVGEIKFSVKRAAGAVSYVHEYTVEPLTPESKWTSKTTTSREHTFIGLPSGMRIYGRITAIGRKGQQATTHTLSRVVQ